MLTQYMTIILPAGIGAVAAIIVCLFSNLVFPLIFQRLTHKAEDQRQLEKKVEEAHTLTNQIKIWYTVKFNEAYETEGIDNVFERIPFWFVDTTNKEVGCPIEELDTVIRIYIPALYPLLRTFTYYVHNIHNLRIAQQSSIPKERCTRLVNTFITNLELQEFLFSVKPELDKEIAGYITSLAQDHSYGSLEAIQHDIASFKKVDIEWKDQKDAIRERMKLRGYIFLLANNFARIHEALQTSLEQQVGRVGARNRYGDVERSHNHFIKKVNESH